MLVRALLLANAHRRYCYLLAGLAVTLALAIHGHIRAGHSVHGKVAVVHLGWVAPCSVVVHPLIVHSPVVLAIGRLIVIVEAAAHTWLIVIIEATTVAGVAWWRCTIFMAEPTILALTAGALSKELADRFALARLLRLLTSVIVMEKGAGIVAAIAILKVLAGRLRPGVAAASPSSAGRSSAIVATSIATATPAAALVAPAEAATLVTITTGGAFVAPILQVELTHFFLKHLYFNSYYLSQGFWGFGVLGF